MIPAVIRGYQRAAASLIPRFEAVSSEATLAPVRAWLDRPVESEGQIAWALDIGAGSGRDAAWLAARGWRVVAAEPTPAMRGAGRQRHPDPSIRWCAAGLPALAALPRRPARYSLILMAAVWQHLPPSLTAAAWARLAGLACPNGRLVVSLRRGPGAIDRPVWPASVDETLEQASVEGFTPLDVVDAPAVQAGNRAAGVSWTWLVLGRDAY